MSFAAKRKKKSSNRIKDKQVPHTVLQKHQRQTSTSHFPTKTISKKPDLPFKRSRLYLVRAKVRAKLSTKRSTPAEGRRSYDVNKLKQVAVRNNFQMKLANRFQILDMIDETEMGVNAKWQTIEEVVKESAEEEIGYLQIRKNAH